MLVVARVLLVFIAGFLASKGYIPEELRQMLTTDPDVATALSGGLVLIWALWWRIAKRFGWRT